MYRCERNNNNNNVPTMQTEMENGKYCDNGNTVETGPQELTAARTAPIA